MQLRETILNISPDYLSYLDNYVPRFSCFFEVFRESLLVLRTPYSRNITEGSQYVYCLVNAEGLAYWDANL